MTLQLDWRNSKKSSQLPLSWYRTRCTVGNWNTVAFKLVRIAALPQLLDAFAMSLLISAKSTMSRSSCFRLIDRIDLAVVDEKNERAPSACSSDVGPATN